MAKTFFSKIFNLFIDFRSWKLRNAKIIVLTVCTISCEHSTEFNSNVWKTNAKTRYTMTDDIINNKLLIGKSKYEIVKILGSDFEEGPCDNCIGYSTNNPDIGFSIDHEVLSVYFDNSNNVIEVRMDMW